MRKKTKPDGVLEVQTHRSHLAFPNGFNGDAAVTKKTASLYGVIRVTTTTDKRKQSLFSSVVCDGDMKEQWDVTLCRISYDLLREWHLLQSPAGQGWEMKEMMFDWSWFWTQQVLQQSYLKVTLVAVVFFYPAVSHSRLSCTKIKKLRSQLLDINVFWNILCFSCCPYPDIKSWKVQCSSACRWTWTFHPGVIGCTFKNRAARPSVTTKPRQLMCCYKDNSAFVRWWGLEIKQQGLIHWGCGESGSHSLVLCHCSRALPDKGASQQMLLVNLFIPVPLCVVCFCWRVRWISCSRSFLTAAL